MTLDQKKLVGELLAFSRTKITKRITRNLLRESGLRNLEDRAIKLFGSLTNAFEQAGLDTIKVSRNKTIPPLNALSQHSSPRTNNWSLGTAAEFYVIAELLYQGFNATKFNVDTGLDVLAIKDKDFYYFQVKNFTPGPNNKDVELTTESFLSNRGNIYYVIVIRRNDTDKDVLILPKYKVREIAGVNLDQRSIKLRIRLELDKVFIKDIDVSRYLNNWDLG